MVLASTSDHTTHLPALPAPSKGARRAQDTLLAAGRALWPPKNELGRLSLEGLVAL